MLRATDLAVQADLGLSARWVTAEKIGVVADRAAGLQARLATEVWGGPQPRDGSGRIVETYPTAALYLWGLPYRGYKYGREAPGRRAEITDQLPGLTGIDVAKVREACVEDEAILDAVISAIVAVLVLEGDAEPVADPAAGRVEGWIRLPKFAE